jgi:hypothetical protein
MCRKEDGELAVDRDRIYQALRNLDGERELRTLLEREIAYDYDGDFISGDDLPEDAAGELVGNPKLSLSTERRIMDIEG